MWYDMTICDVVWQDLAYFNDVIYIYMWFKIWHVIRHGMMPQYVERVTWQDVECRTVTLMSCNVICHDIPNLILVTTPTPLDTCTSNKRCRYFSNSWICTTFRVLNKIYKYIYYIYIFHNYMKYSLCMRVWALLLTTTWWIVLLSFQADTLKLCNTAGHWCLDRRRFPWCNDTVDGKNPAKTSWCQLMW